MLRLREAGQGCPSPGQLVADEAAQKIHKLTNKSAMRSSIFTVQIRWRCRVQSVQMFCILLLQMFLFAENGSRGPQRLCARLLVLPMQPRLGGYMIRTLRVLSASARGCCCYS